MAIEIIPGAQAWSHARRNARARWPTREQPERLSPLAEPASGNLFALRGDEKVFCIGSCFAREIETTLDRLGFEVMSLKPVLPPSPNRSVADRRMFNKYNVGTILNELRWALEPERFPYRHEDVLVSAPGNLLVQDYQLRGEAWADERGVAMAFREAFNRFFASIREAEVVVLTLGLSEAWYDSATGLYLNAAPTEHMVREHGERFELHVLDGAMTLAMLDEIDRLLVTHLRPGFRLLLTVSPVPLASTFRAQDVLVANSYSKSVLRACCDQFLQGRPHARYFPSYEFVTLSEPALVWSLDDFRHVDPKFVDYIMASVLAGLGGRSAEASELRARARQRLLEQHLVRRPGATLSPLARLRGVLGRGLARLAQGLRLRRQQPPRVRGHLDRWNGSELVGWAFDEQTDRPVAVTVRIDGKLVAERRADDEREDVASTLGVEHLQSGFHFSLSELPPDARQLTVHVGGRLLKSIALRGGSPTA